MADGFPESYAREQLRQAAASVTVELSHLSPGEHLAVMWVGYPIWIYRRTPEDLAYLGRSSTGSLADPENKNTLASIQRYYGVSSALAWATLLLEAMPIGNTIPYRSIDKEYLVVGAWAPYSGCALRVERSHERHDPRSVFFDPCTEVYYDAAGRAHRTKLPAIFRDPEARFNMFIPPHRYDGPSRLVIGITKQLEPKLDKRLVPSVNYYELDATEALLTAVGYNDFTAAKDALQRGAQINRFVPGRGVAIDRAIIGSSDEIVKYLLGLGARPSDKSIMLARTMKRWNLVELLGK